MKNKFVLINVILIAIISISTISLGFSIDMEMDKTENLNVDDEVILTLNLSEKIVGASFKINYDTNSLKLLDKETQNLYVSENNRQVACVYIDMEDNGTDILKIKFKVLNTDITNLDFSLEEAKFIVLGDKTSYSENDIIGISKTMTIKKTSNNDNNNDNDNNSDNIGNDTNNNQNNNANNSNNGTNNNTGNVSNNNTNNINNNDSSSNKNNNSNKKDNTTVNTSIPKTGTSDIIFVFIGVTILSVIYFGIRLRKISKC